MSDYFLTYLWTWMECFSAILLFDAFSARKMKRFRHWIIVTSLAFLEATFLNIASKALPDYSKILIALVLYYFVHRILYISNRFFGLYISIIIYATMCCIDNLWHTLALLLSETLNGVFLGNALCQSMLVHGIIIVVCFLQAKARNGKLSQATNFRWYTIPAVLSLASVLLIFFFGSCFQQGQISIQPLCVCATFITVMQIAALLLISWILQNETYKGDTRYQKHYTANLFPTKVSHNRGQVSQYYIAKSHEAIISDEDFDKVQSLLKMKAPHKPKVAEKLFDQKLYCAVCGTLFARKTRTSGAVVWGCRKHLNKSGLCPVKSVYETELCRAFLCMHNKLLINQEKIFEPLLNSLSHLKSYQEKLDTMRMGIQVEIQRLAKQKHNLERIYAQGLIEDSQYLERKALIEQQLFEKKEFLTRKPLAGNIDRLLKNTRQIKRLLGTCQPLMYFDKQVFTSLVSKVTINDTSFEFELINGMRVSERRTSK